MVRYDSWNPTTNGLEAGCMDNAMGAMATTVANDTQNTLGGGFIGYISGNLKLTAIYEWLIGAGNRTSGTTTSSRRDYRQGFSPIPRQSLSLPIQEKRQ